MKNGPLISKGARRYRRYHTHIIPSYHCGEGTGGSFKKIVQRRKREHKDKTQNRSGVSKTHAKEEETVLKQWWLQLCLGEVFVYEGRKKESSLLIKYNQMLSTQSEQTRLVL